MRNFFLTVVSALLLLNVSGAKADTFHNIPGGSAKLVYSSTKSDRAKVTGRESFVSLQSNFTEETTVQNNNLTRAGGPLNAIYTLPDGFYYLGLDASHASFSEDQSYLFGPAYYEGSVWKNLSLNADSYKWYYTTTPMESGNMDDLVWETSEEEEIDIVYPFGIFPTPSLLAMTNEKDTMAYRWGASYGYLWAGGHSSVVLSDGRFDFGATNLDHFFFGINLTSLSSTSYAFGSNQYGVNSVYELFSKPVTTYLLDQVRIGMGILIVPAGSEFNLIIHRFVDGEPKDTIATATWVTPQSYYFDQEEGYNYLGFDEFDVEIDGVKSKTNRLEINDAILIEFSGFNSSPNITMAIGDQADESYDGKCTAYVGIETADGKVIKRTDEAYSTKDGPLKTSLAFMLDMIYPWLVLENEIVELSLNGDAKVIDFNAFFEQGKEDGYLTFENVPEWLTVNVLEYELDTDYKVKVEFKAEKTDENRQAEITATIPGCNLDFVVKQDASVNDIKQEKTANIQVMVAESSIDITFDADFRSLSLYDISGKKINEFYLQNTREFTIPSYCLDKGVYLLNFEGETSETIKIVK